MSFIIRRFWYRQLQIMNYLWIDKLSAFFLKITKYLFKKINTKLTQISRFLSINILIMVLIVNTQLFVITDEKVIRIMRMERGLCFTSTKSHRWVCHIPIDRTRAHLQELICKIYKNFCRRLPHPRAPQISKFVRNRSKIYKP